MFADGVEEIVTSESDESVESTVVRVVGFGGGAADDNLSCVASAEPRNRL